MDTSGYLMEHIDSQLQTSWFISVNLNLPLSRSLSVHAVCSFITPSCRLVCSFDTIYHPTDFTVMNETQKLWCIILDFMLYLLYGQKKKKHEKLSKNTTQM